MTDQKVLSPSLKLHFAPKLRSLGFKGSGKKYRRLSTDCVHVVGIQMYSGGGSFAVNLGIQPIDIPDIRGNPVDEKNITPEVCEFRRRLSETGVDQWWDFDSSASADKAVRECEHIFAEFGDPAFLALTGPKSQLRTVTPSEFENGAFHFSGFGSTKIRTAMVLSRMRKASGDAENARNFALIGLKLLGSATGLRTELQALSQTP